MHLRSRFLVLALAAALGACRTAQSRSAASDSGTNGAASESDFLVRRVTFIRCELEGFISLGVARNAMVFNATKASTLDKVGKAPWQRSMIEELFARVERGTVHSHPRFAAEKFYECAEREGVVLAKNVDGATICLARLDIVFYLDADRNRGRTQEEALARFQRGFAHVSKDVFPPALVEKLAPMVYRITEDNDGEYELRRLVFETCLFPEDWKAWWEAVGSKQE